MSCRPHLSLLVAAVLLLTTAKTFAGDLDKSFKYLNTGDYTNAYKYLQEAIRDEPQNVAANFGMAKFYSLKDNQQYNIDSANIFIKRAAAKIPLDPKDKQTKKFLSLGVRDYTIQNLQNEINQAGYSKYQQQNTVDAYQFFIDNYTDSILLIKAIANRNQLAFNLAKDRNDPDALDSFMKKYPDAVQVKEAKTLYEKLLYEQTTADHTYQSYKHYLDNYPNGPYAAEAKKNYQNKLLEYYNNRHDLEGYVEFDNNYPDHPARGAMQDSIFAIVTASGTIEAYKNFVEHYKNNRNLKQAYDKLYVLFTAKGRPDSYQKFLDAYPNYPDKERVYRDMALAKMDLKPFKQGDKWGYAYQPTPDSIAMIIPALYEEALPFKEGLAGVRTKPCDDNCTYFYIDKHGDRAIEGNFNFTGDFNNGLAIVGIGNCDADSCLYGLINKAGKWVVPPTYEELNDPAEGMYLVSKGNKYGYLNADGKLVIDLIFTDALPFSDGTAGVEKDSTWFFIDKTGKQLFVGGFQDVSSFKEDLCAATTDGVNWGYIDKTGNFVIPPLYEAADDFDSSFAVVSKKEKDIKHRGLFISQRYKIDKTGKIVEKLTAPGQPKKKSTRRRGRR